MARKYDNIGNTPGFDSPLGKQAQRGDAANATPAATPTGPPRDPIGNLPPMKKGPMFLPVSHGSKIRSGGSY